MRMFPRILLCSVLASSLTLVSCGSRDDGSMLAGDRNSKDDQRSEEGNDHNDSGKAKGRFPKAPHKEMTPGSLCEKGNKTRYPEKVKYCERDVNTETKRQIFVTYDKEFGYQTTQMERSSFKIDHLVPLCLGGSNEIDNLWPQHVSVYENTDPLEPFLCEVLSAGRIKQAEAVELILTIKEDPETAPDELRKLESRF